MANRDPASVAARLLRDRPGTAAGVRRHGSRLPGRLLGLAAIAPVCALIAALEAELASAGIDVPVYWGNRNWDPYLAEVLGDLPIVVAASAAWLWPTSVSGGWRKSLIAVPSRRNSGLTETPKPSP